MGVAADVTSSAPVALSSEYPGGGSGTMVKVTPSIGAAERLWLSTNGLGTLSAEPVMVEMTVVSYRI